MTTNIKLSQNLHEKMEFAISDYIHSLRECEHDHGIVLRVYGDSSIDYIIGVLFKHSSYKCKESNLFNKIAKEYFVKSEYNELQQFNDAYFKYADDDDDDSNDVENGIPWKYNYNENLYLEESKHIVLIDPAYVFAKLNVNFIKEQLSFVDTMTLLK